MKELSMQETTDNLSTKDAASSSCLASQIELTPFWAQPTKGEKKENTSSSLYMMIRVLKPQEKIELPGFINNIDKFDPQSLIIRIGTQAMVEHNFYSSIIQCRSEVIYLKLAGPTNNLGDEYMTEEQQEFLKSMSSGFMSCKGYSLEGLENLKRYIPLVRGGYVAESKGYEVCIEELEKKMIPLYYDGATLHMMEESREKIDSLDRSCVLL